MSRRIIRAFRISRKHDVIHGTTYGRKVRFVRFLPTEIPYHGVTTKVHNRYIARGNRKPPIRIKNRLPKAWLRQKRKQ